MYRLNLFIKRCIDVPLCLVAVIFLIPVWMIVALAIKLDSKGPVFFKQGRRTKDGRIFQMLKFRSMVVDSSTPTHWSLWDNTNVRRGLDALVARATSVVSSPLYLVMYMP